jgi:hypothetical protein
MVQRLPGLLVAIFGFLFLHQSWDLGWGTATKLGAGFWPSVLSLSLLVIGMILAVTKTTALGNQTLKLWPTVTLLGTIIIYGLMITQTGLILTALLILVLSLLARYDSINLIGFLIAGAVMYTVLIFLRLLGIDTPLWPLSLCC